MVSAVLTMASCKPTVPSRYIQPDDMEDLLYDFHVAQAMADESGKNLEERNFNQTLYFAAVLEKHGVTKAEFDSSLTYYYIRADRFNEIYKNVAKRLSEDAMELGASEGEVNRYAKLNNNGDTTDVWTGPLSVMLLPYAPYHKVTFVQKADTSFRKGDSFMFMVNTDFIVQSGSRNGQACIAIKYDNDTVVSRNMSLTVSGINQVRIPELVGRKAKEIRGFFYLNPEREETTTLKLMVVNNIQLIKFRNREIENEQKKDSVGLKKLQPIDLPKN